MSKSRVDGVTVNFAQFSLFARNLTNNDYFICESTSLNLRCKRMHYAGEITQYKARLFAPSVKKYACIKAGMNYFMPLAHYKRDKGEAHVRSARLSMAASRHKTAHSCLDA